MRDYLEIGPCPVNEDAAQIGDAGFDAANQSETFRFLRLIERTVGAPPEGASLVIRTHRHDFGCYREVAVKFDDRFPLAVDYAFHVESNSPEDWIGTGALPWTEKDARARIESEADNCDLSPEELYLR